MKGFIARHKKLIQEIGIGLFIYETINFLYDWLFYPFALVYWGVFTGGIILFSGSIIQCALMFWLYDRMKVDWLGANALRQLDDKENKSRLERLAVWLGKEKKTLWERLLSPIVFIGLTLPIDPLIVAIHYRKKHFGGVGVRDWLILLSAVVVANAWWLIKIEIVIQLFQVAFNFFR